MNRRLILAGLSATGGLVTAAFLQVAVAAADISASGADTFTIGNYTFDPFTVGTTGADVEGFAPVDTLTGAPPLLELGEFTPQSFEVFDPTTGADLGSVDTSETVTDLLSLVNSAFTVEDVAAADGGSASDLPTVGSVYDAFNFGGGFENVYTAIPSTTGGADTDTLVTPLGNVNLDSLFRGIDAAAPLNPGAAFTGLLQSGDSSIGPDAFSIGNTTFDPTLAAGGEGFDPVIPLVGAPPLLELGGGAANLGGGALLPLATQDFNIYNLAGTEVGSIHTTEAVTALLGSTDTDFTVTSVDPLAGEAGSSALPTVGSVYDVFNISGGLENIYTAIPGVDGGADTVTDTAVTPLGVIDLDALFGNIDAIAPLNPGDAFTAGLDAASAAVTSVDPLPFLGL
jgi:hypothetical protein